MFYFSDYNIYDNDTHTTIKLNVPGFTKKDINISFEKEFLKIEGEIKEENDEELIHEGLSLKYHKMFEIGNKYNIEKTNANIINGQLIIKLPKKEELKPRKILIE